MSKQDELNLFLDSADDLIKSSYIIADAKIVALLKSIASSETLIAIFKNCLQNFDYEEAKKKYFVKSKFLEDKGQFILPQTSRDLLATVFSVLLEIDEKKIVFSEFIKKYFYEDGSFSAGYSLFINSMIIPFKNSVKALMESVIDGRLEDPIEAFTKEEEKRIKEQEEKQKLDEQKRQLLKTQEGKTKKEILDFLLCDKDCIKDSKLKPEEKSELIYVVDMLANVIGSGDKEAIRYAFLTYKYCSKVYSRCFYKKAKKVKELIKALL